MHSASDETGSHSNEKGAAKPQHSTDSYLSVLDQMAESKRLEDYQTFGAVLKSPMFILMTVWTTVVQGFIVFVIGIIVANVPEVRRRHNNC